uniref:Secreted protein n=1 Tax=Ixodes ricinus TaxID=34613 RepID=A0A147BBR0_IXORI
MRQTIGKLALTLVGWVKSTGCCSCWSFVVVHDHSPLLGLLDRGHLADVLGDHLVVNRPFSLFLHGRVKREAVSAIRNVIGSDNFVRVFPSDRLVLGYRAVGAQNFKSNDSMECSARKVVRHHDP